MTQAMEGFFEPEREAIERDRRESGDAGVVPHLDVLQALADGPTDLTTLSDRLGVRTWTLARWVTELEDRRLVVTDDTDDTVRLSNAGRQAIGR